MNADFASIRNHHERAVFDAVRRRRAALPAARRRGAARRRRLRGAEPTAAALHPPRGRSRLLSHREGTRRGRPRRRRGGAVRLRVRAGAPRACARASDQRQLDRPTVFMRRPCCCGVRISTVGKLTGRVNGKSRLKCRPRLSWRDQRASARSARRTSTRLRSSSRSRVTRKLRVVLVDLARCSSSMRCSARSSRLVVRTMPT